MNKIKVFCNKCKYYHWMISPGGDWCDSPDSFGENWYGKNERLKWVSCSDKNKNNDCKDFLMKE